MEVGFWAARVNSSKNIPFALSSRHNTNNINHLHDGKGLLLVSMSGCSGSCDYETEEGEGSTAGDEECSELDWHSSRTEKDMKKPNNSTRNLSKLESLKLPLEKLQLSCRERNLLSNSSSTSKSKHWQEVETKPLANVLNIKFEDASDAESCDEELSCDEEECDEEEECNEVTEIEGESCKDDDARVCIACPLCDIDIEVVVLHSHLQEDHGFEFKNAVCPVCAANLGKDVIGHFITNHTSSLKFRRKSKTSGLWTTSAMFGKELSSFLGSSTNGKGNAFESAPDPLLSPFLSCISDPEPKQKLLGESSGNGSSLSRPLKSAEPSFVESNNGVDSEERRPRAAFVRQLIASLIF